MAKARLRTSPALVGLCGLALLGTHVMSEEGLHKVWAVKDCRILTLAGPAMAKGTVLIRDGLIESVGPGILIPADAEVIDGSKLTAYPGLVDGLGQSLLKLPEEKFDPVKIYTGEFTDRDAGILPERKAFDHVSLGKSTLEKYHKAGLLAAHVLPDKGVLTGQASFFSLSAEDRNAAVLLRDTWLGIGYVPSSFNVYPNTLMGVVAFLRQEFADVAYYGEHAARWAKELRGLKRPAFSSRSEILLDYVKGRKPVVFLCNNQNDIRRSLDLADRHRLDFLICDLGGEAFRVIPELKAARARVLCTVAFKAPVTSVFSQQGKNERERAEKEVYLRNPAKLAEAGIPFAFSSLGTDDPKSFLEGIEKAIEAGLAKEAAWRALTVAPVSFLGLDRALGTIEAGKIANLVLAEGEPLAKESKVVMVFADGRKFELKEAKAKEGEQPTVNVSGKWELNIAEAGMKVTVDFLQEEASLSGKMVMPFGMFEFTGGDVSGNEIYFEMTLSAAGQEIDLYFSATVTGDTMRGTVVQGTQGAFEFTGRRIP